MFTMAEYQAQLYQDRNKEDVLSLHTFASDNIVPSLVEEVTLHLTLNSRYIHIVKVQTGILMDCTFT